MGPLKEALVDMPVVVVADRVRQTRLSQADAVAASTSLVTLTVGGNDTPLSVRVNGCSATG